MKLNLNKWSRGRKKERARHTLQIRFDLFAWRGSTPPPSPRTL